MKHPVRKALVALISGLLNGVSGTTAVAVTSDSSFKTAGTWSGYTHKCRAWIDNTTKRAGTTATTPPAAPAGWSGALAIMSRSSDALCASSNEVFTSSGGGIGISGYGNCGSYYYSKGTHASYTGSGCHYTSTHQSPNLLS